MSLRIHRLARLTPSLQNSILNKHQVICIRRSVFNDSSRPFPPPQPTRPIDHLDDSTTGNNADQKEGASMSTTIDAVSQDPTLHHLKDPNTLIKSHHFDTYQLMKNLENQGFTRKQAEVIMKGIKFRLREW